LCNSKIEPFRWIEIARQVRGGKLDVCHFPNYKWNEFLPACQINKGGADGSAAPLAEVTDGKKARL
jgi:hypothetical protein